MSASTTQEPPKEAFPPELQLLVSGLPKDQAEAMETAFYSVCQGDPKSPPVQFGLFGRRHLQTMIAHTARMNQAVDRHAEIIREMVDLPRLKKMLDDHQTKVTDAVDLIVASNRELYETEKKVREAEFKIRESAHAHLDLAMTTVTKATQALEKTAHDLMWAMAVLAVAIVLVVGGMIATGHLR